MIFLQIGQKSQKMLRLILWDLQKIVSSHIKYKTCMTKVKLFPNEKLKQNYDYINRILFMQDFLENFGEI